MSEDFKERRKYARFEHGFTLFFYLKGKKDVHYEMSQVNNISRGGVYFSSNVVLPSNGDIVIDIKTPFLDQNVELTGIILACREKIPGKLYGVHVEFRGLSAQAEDILKRVETWNDGSGS